MIGKLTNQNELFPIIANGYSNNVRYQYEIKDDFLYRCIARSGSVDCGLKITSFTETKHTGYAFLVFFTSLALGRYRLPYHPDRIFSENHLSSEVARINKILTADRVAVICDEVRTIYQHTQNALKEKNISMVRLRRNLRIDSGPVRDKFYWPGMDEPCYASLLSEGKIACNILGRKNFAVEMDFLNSYGDDGGYAHFGVYIEHDIPVENVFYCNNLIQLRGRTGTSFAASGAVESGEWVILNDALDGVVDLSPDDINFRTGVVDNNKMSSEKWAENWFKRNDPLVLRPLAVATQHSSYLPHCNRRLTRDVVGRIRGALQILWRGYIR